MILSYEQPTATVFLFAPRETLAHNDDERLRNSAAPVNDDDFDAGTSLEDSIFG